VVAESLPVTVLLSGVLVPPDESTSVPFDVVGEPVVVLDVVGSGVLSRGSAQLRIEVATKKSRQKRGENRRLADVARATRVSATLEPEVSVWRRR